MSTLPTTGAAEGTREGPYLELPDRVSLYRFMALQRAVEERGLSLYKQGRVPGSFYDGRGQEATCVGATYALGAADTVCPLIRDMGAHLVRGTTPLAILAHYLGRAGGVGRGRDGNVHLRRGLARGRRHDFDARRHDGRRGGNGAAPSSSAASSAARSHSSATARRPSATGTRR